MNLFQREIPGRPESLLGPPRPCEETTWFAFAPGVTSTATPLRPFGCPSFAAAENIRGNTRDALALAWTELSFLCRIASKRFWFRRAVRFPNPPHCCPARGWLCMLCTAWARSWSPCRRKTSARRPWKRIQLHIQSTSGPYRGIPLRCSTVLGEDCSEQLTPDDRKVSPTTAAIPPSRLARTA